MEVDGVMVMKFLSKLQKTNALKDAGIEHKAGEAFLMERGVSILLDESTVLLRFLTCKSPFAGLLARDRIALLFSMTLENSY